MLVLYFREKHFYNIFNLLKQLLISKNWTTIQITNTIPPSNTMLEKQCDFW